MNRPDRLSELVHDMRNRLAVARANVEAFIDGKLQPTADRLDAVLQSLNQLEELLKDFRADQAAAEAHVRRAHINVCDLVAREYRSVAAVASAKGVTLDVSRCAEKSERSTQFAGDPVLIGQIISNVLLNAVRYTPPGGTIGVDCSRHAGQLEVSIADSGPGIAPSEAERILAMAKEFVETNGGTIAAAASAHNSARFVIRLPGSAASAQRTDGRHVP